MADLGGEDEYVEPPLSQLEIPYKMHFSSSEDEKKKKENTKTKEKKEKKSRKFMNGNNNKRKIENYSDDSSDDDDSSSSSSSSCGSFDSNPDRKVTNREPLRVNDIISYTPPIFTIGTNVKQAVVLGIWPNHKSFPLILDTADMLPWDTSIQRIGEFYQEKIYKHSGRIKPLSSFRLQEGGTKDVTIGLQQKASNFKQMLHDMQQRAMATLRGEIKPPSQSQSPSKPVRKQAPSSVRGSSPSISGNRKDDMMEDLASTSSDSSSSLSAMRKRLQSREKRPMSTSTRNSGAITSSAHSKMALDPSSSKNNKSVEESSDDSSSSSSSSSNDESIPLKDLIKKPRGYRNNRLSLSKNNNTKMTSPTPRGTNNRSLSTPAQTIKGGNSKKSVKPSFSASTKHRPISVDDSSDDSSSSIAKPTKRKNTSLKKKNTAENEGPTNNKSSINSFRPLKPRASRKNNTSSLKKNNTAEDNGPTIKKRSDSFRTSMIIANLNDDTDSDDDNEKLPSPLSSKGLVTEQAQNKMEKHRQARKSFDRPDTYIWSGSDCESDHDAAGIEKTLESRRRGRNKPRRAFGGHQDSLANLLPPSQRNQSNGGNNNKRITSEAPPKVNTNYSNKELDIGSSSSSSSSDDEPSIIVEKPRTKVTTQKKKQTKTKKELPRLPLGASTNAALGLGSEDSSDDDDDELFKTPITFVKKKKKNKQSPEKQALYNRTNQKDETTNTRRTSTFAVGSYDADEDSENEKSILAKPVWHHNHSSERVVKSPSPSSKKKKQTQTSKDPHKISTPTSSNRKVFSKSPNNKSRSRLVQEICRQKIMSSPSPAKANYESLKQKYELSSSSVNDSASSDSEEEEEEARRRRAKRKKRRRKKDWSDDESSIESPPPEEEVEYMPTPTGIQSRKTNRKRHGSGGSKNKRHRESRGLDFDAPSSEEEPRRARRILTPNSRRGKKAALSSSTKKWSSCQKRPKTAHGRNRRR